MGEKLLKTKELCERWQCSPDVVSKHIQKGLKAIPLSARDYRFSIKDIEEYEEQLKTAKSSYDTLNFEAKDKMFKIAKIKNYQLV